MREEIHRDLFDGVTHPFPDSSSRESGALADPMRVHLHSFEELSAMSRPVLLSYVLRLQEAFGQLQGENEFLSWEFKDLRDNLAFFSRATKMAHQLNAADIETIASVAVNDLPTYFGCDSAALFFRHPLDGHFELYRVNNPLTADFLPADADCFLERLFTSYSQPFVARYFSAGHIALGDAEGCGTEAVSEKWFQTFGEAALVFPFRINECGGDEERGELLLGGLIIGLASRTLNAGDEDMAVIFCDLLASSLHNARLMRKLNDLTIIDPLTQLYNRRHLFKQLDSAVLQARRHGYPLSMAMIDIDHFKCLNDAHGHLGGDEVLRWLGVTLKSYTRLGIDTAARYGGEEFVLLMPFTAIEAGVEVAERLRRRIKEAGVDFRGRSLSVTASIGVTSYQPDEDPESFVSRADAALYHAKNAGRDRVRCL